MNLAKCPMINMSDLVFFNCMSTGSGGAINIYTYFQGGQVFMSRICGYICFCNQNGHFLQSLTSCIDMNYISLTKCSNTTTKNYPIDAIYGKQNFLNSNSSYNKAEYGASIDINCPSFCNINFSTFSYNEASHSTNVHLFGNGSKGKVLYTNVIGCNSPKTAGVVTISGGYTISYSVFMDNINVLFCQQIDSTSISLCYIDHPTQYSRTSGQLYISSAYTKPTQVPLNLTHFSTFLCQNIISLPTKVPSMTSRPKHHLPFFILFLVLVC